jgi:hypothetical protein
MHTALPTIDRASADAFTAWAQAYADLIAAERAGHDADQTMELTSNVLRARIALVRTRTAAGWLSTEESAKRLRLDEYLLRLGEKYP